MVWPGIKNIQKSLLDSTEIVAPATKDQHYLKSISSKLIYVRGSQKMQSFLYLLNWKILFEKKSPIWTEKSYMITKKKPSFVLRFKSILLLFVTRYFFLHDSKSWPSKKTFTLILRINLLRYWTTLPINRCFCLVTVKKSPLKKNVKNQ